MSNQKQITQIRYSLKDALESVPKRDYQKAKEAIKGILGITSRQQFDLYLSGNVTPPGLHKAKAVEKYFKDNYGINNPWKEISPN